MATHPSVAAKKALPTTGTQLFLLNKRTAQMFEVPCVTSIGTISAPNEMEDVTCMRDTARVYQAQLSNPGTTTFGVRFNPSQWESRELFEARNRGDDFAVALAFPQFDENGIVVHPDDAESPEVDTTDPGDPVFVLGEDRIHVVFNAVLMDFPISGETGGNFDASIELQISGNIELAPESALPERPEEDND